MRGTILIVVLVHALSTCHGICFPETSGYGHCLELHKCNYSIAMPARCKSVQDTPLYCCPEENIIKSDEWDSIQSTLKFPLQCGETPMCANAHVKGGYEVEAVQYSWMASLQYENKSSFGTCGGSVINSRYVLTAAHCVTGAKSQSHGPVTGVRLGDFNQNSVCPESDLYKKSTCDYGAIGCQQYQEFGISKIIVHDNYQEGKFHSDIALLRLSRSIIFTDKLRPICLPFNMPEVAKSTLLTLSGWGLSFEIGSTNRKRAVMIPLNSTETCKKEDESFDENQICGGVIGENGGIGKGSCDGDSGCPLMDLISMKRMVLEGIVSHGLGLCSNQFAPSYFTRVRSFLTWIELQMYID